MRLRICDGERWVAAVAVLKPQDGEPEFLGSGETGSEVFVSTRTTRSEAMRRFRDFLEKTECDVRAGRAG